MSGTILKLVLNAFSVAAESVCLLTLNSRSFLTVTFCCCCLPLSYLILLNVDCISPI